MDKRGTIVNNVNLIRDRKLYTPKWLIKFKKILYKIELIIMKINKYRKCMFPKTEQTVNTSSQKFKTEQNETLSSRQDIISSKMSMRLNNNSSQTYKGIKNNDLES